MNHHKQIDVFIDGVKRYFSHFGVSDELLEFGVPYLIENQAPLGRDFTGVISISGSNKGYVFFSSGRSLLSNILLGHGETTFTSEYMSDLVGEIVNTIAGNARASFGEDFTISTPRVVKGPISTKMLDNSRRSYVLPVRWKSNGAQLIVSLDKF